MRYERQLAIKDQTKKFSFLNDWNRHTIETAVDQDVVVVDDRNEYKLF